MALLVDTSALYALVDADDQAHSRAASAFKGLEGEALITHSYVVTESIALIHHRLGWEVARRLVSGLLPAVTIEWVDEALHRSAENAFLAAPSRRISFVDRVSFALMRRDGIDAAFAFDVDFEDAGFETVPGQQ